VSRWHVVELDEVWHFHEGDPLALHLYDPKRRAVEVVELGPASVEGARPQHVVPRGVWQAARPSGAFALVGCTVGPGFDFADFRLVDELPEAAAAFDGPLAAHEDLR
jgi:predicted cupin superfamily sugar epimerase